MTNRDGFIGHLTFRPLDRESVREAIEYLWTAFRSRLGGHKVLSSYSTDTVEAYIVTFFTTRIVFGDWGINDTIYLDRNEYRVDIDTGEVNREDGNIRTIIGKYNPNPLGTGLQ